MKTVVIYKSFLGTTRTYAQWLKEELDCDIKKFSQIGDGELKGYDLMIISSGTYVGYMPLIGFLKKKWEIIKDKKVVVVAVGVAPENEEWSQKSYEKIPAHIREKIKYFKLAGKMGNIKPAGEVKKENLDRIIHYTESSGS